MYVKPFPPFGDKGTGAVKNKLLSMVSKLSFKRDLKVDRHPNLYSKYSSNQ